MIAHAPFGFNWPIIIIGKLKVAVVTSVAASCL